MLKMFETVRRVTGHRAKKYDSGHTTLKKKTAHAAAKPTRNRSKVDAVGRAPAYGKYIE